MQAQITDIVTSLYNVEQDVVLTRPEAQFGDYATNVALQLAKPLGRNPREIAQEIADRLTETGDFKDVTVAGPGFINLTLTDAALLADAERAPRPQHSNTHFVVEYSCPNAFKELHTGHLYQTVFGDILARLIEQSGARVSRTSFGGDVGLHVAKCLWGMVDRLGGELPERLDHDIPEDAMARANWISGCYVRGARAYEDNEAVRQYIDEQNKTIYGFHESGDMDSPLAQLYWKTRQWSFDYFAAFYDLIDVDLMRYYPESQTAPVGMNVVKEQLAVGALKESGGAVIFEGDESKHLHTRVFITSKGLPTYETKDIGVIWMEKADYGFDKRILITGNDQKEYMRVLFAAAETFDQSLEGTMTHLTHGTVKFGDGSKMSSRLGNVSRAADVIDTVRDKVRELVDDEALVELVTLGAIKYVFAKYRVGGDIAFDIDETVTLNGNSGPYLQYAHARACSILAKSTETPTETVTEFDESERLLVRKIGEYAEVVEKASRDYTTHGICTYLYELAQTFNRFYEGSRIIGDPRERERLQLVSTYSGTLRNGLALLGIHAPERM